MGGFVAWRKVQQRNEGGSLTATEWARRCRRAAFGQDGQKNLIQPPFRHGAVEGIVSSVVGINAPSIIPVVCRGSVCVTPVHSSRPATTSPPPDPPHIATPSSSSLAMPDPYYPPVISAELRIGVHQSDCNEMAID